MQKKCKKNDRLKANKEKSFLPSKKYHEKIFTCIYDCVKNDMYPLQIAQYLSKKYREKWTKQRVNHWLKQLVRRGLIEKTMKTSYTKYATVGTSKNFLIGDERVKNFDLHNIEITIPLKCTGNLPEGNIEMNNWKYASMNFGDFTVNVNYGKEPKLKIYPPNTYGNELSEVLIRCGSEVRCIASLLENNYKCSVRMNDLSVRRKPHLHSKNDPIIKQIDKEKIQYNGKHIEFNRSGDAHGDILGFDGMVKYDQLLNTVPLLINDLEAVKQTMGGLAHSQTQMFNLQAIMTETLREIKNIAKNGVLRGFPTSSPQNINEPEIKPETKQEINEVTEEHDTENGKMVYIETLMTIPSFMGIRNNNLHTYPEFKRGTKIWIEKQVARILIQQRKAKRI